MKYHCGLPVALMASALLAGCGSAEPMTDNAKVSWSDDGRAGKLVGEDNRIIPVRNILASEDNIKLTPVMLEDFQKLIGPLKGCSFKMKGETDSLLVANAPSSSRGRPKAIVRMGGDAIELTAAKAGRMGYLAAGPEFKGPDFAIEITPDRGTGSKQKVKSLVWDAAMVVRGKGDQVRVYRGGEYSCNL